MELHRLHLRLVYSNSQISWFKISPTIQLAVVHIISILHYRHCELKTVDCLICINPYSVSCSDRLVVRNLWPIYKTKIHIVQGKAEKRITWLKADTNIANTRRCKLNF